MKSQIVHRFCHSNFLLSSVLLATFALGAFPGQVLCKSARGSGAYLVPPPPPTPVLLPPPPPEYFPYPYNISPSTFSKTKSLPAYMLKATTTPSIKEKPGALSTALASVRGYGKPRNTPVAAKVLPGAALATPYSEIAQLTPWEAKCYQWYQQHKGIPSMAFRPQPQSTPEMFQSQWIEPETTPASKFKRRKRVVVSR